MIIDMCKALTWKQVQHYSFRLLRLYNVCSFLI